MNWGYRIVLSFVVFIGIIITMVVISMKQDVGLVSEDYYKQEIAYQDQIERIKRTKALKTQPRIAINRASESLDVTLPQQEIQDGEVWLFRPSNDKMDRKIQLPANGNIQIPIQEMPAGRWQVKVLWTHKGLEYYTEDSIYL